MYLPKDFIITTEGLAFAVVTYGLEAEKVLCFLRYRRTPTGWQKLNTLEANTLLTTLAPQYHYYSVLRDTTCHAVPLNRIAQHLKPRERLQQLLNFTYPIDAPAIQDCTQFLRLLASHAIDLRTVGVTGSILLDAQHATSDIDLVFYDRDIFQQVRQLIPTLINQNKVQHLTNSDWLEAFQRRDCALNFIDYVWHEQRKANKVTFNGRKIDLSLLIPEKIEIQTPFKKIGLVKRTLKISDDILAYDYPTSYKVAESDIEQVISFTATYTGQALTGEWIEVTGHLEKSACGRQRIVVGSSREAHHEYIKVVERYA